MRKSSENGLAKAKSEMQNKMDASLEDELFLLLVLRRIWKIKIPAYSKVPNKRPSAYFFEKKNPTAPPPLPPTPRLLIFGFSSLAPKKFEQCRTYLKI